MKALEFRATGRVIVLASEDEGDQDWRRRAAEQFFKGYAGSGSIYDAI